MKLFNTAVIWCVLTTLFSYAHCAEREYNIAAVEREWDYAPTGINELTGVSLDEDEYVLLCVAFVFIVVALNIDFQFLCLVACYKLADDGMRSKIFSLVSTS